MKGLLIKTLMIFPKIIDKIGKMNTMHQLKSMKNALFILLLELGKHFLLLSKEAKITIKEGVVNERQQCNKNKKKG